MRINMIKNLSCLLLLVSGSVMLHGQTKTVAIDKGTIERGKIVYESLCLACHQADGSGVPNLNPPLIKTKWTIGDKNELIDVILNGMDEEIEVDGEIYNNVMPPLNHLSDREIADVLTYVRNSFSNKASTITEADVKARRPKQK